MEPERYAMVEASNPDMFNLFKKIRLSYKPLGESKLIHFTSDFHKTNDSDKFIDVEDASPDDIPLYEGKFMNQFKIMPNNILYVVKRSDVNKKTGNLYHESRIVLRAIGRATDKRTLIATLLPQNSTGANSIQMEKNHLEIKTKLFLLGFLNSYVIDYVLRQLVSVNINKIYLQQLPLPSENEVIDHNEISQIVKELLKENEGYYYKGLDELVPGDAYAGKSHDELIAELNARVMIDFNLTRPEIVTLMKTFESANHKQDVRDETQRILDCFDELTK